MSTFRISYFPHFFAKLPDILQTLSLHQKSGSGKGLLNRKRKVLFS